ncbi:S-layer homology domain-containing protein [Paenibacillus glycanilyticus]|uniref:S-layer homology domain-containing protein n=1 Tax=Paenibacillus glycanilyticus TaxID=126569 RepID=UPI003EBF438C
MAEQRLGESSSRIASNGRTNRRDGETMGKTGKKLALTALAAMMGALPAAGLPATAAEAGSGASPLYGNFEDWNGGHTNQETANNRMESIKAVNQDGKLYVMAKGSGMNRAKTLYINADNNAATGANIAGWRDSGGIDYKIEGDAAYAYENGNWVQRGQVVLKDNDTVAEYEIDLTALPAADPAGKIKVGLLSEGSMLPELGELMVPVQPSSSGGAAQAAPPPPTNLAIDGDGAEWADVPELLRSTDGKTTVKYAVSSDALHMLIEGRIDNGEFPDLWEHLLIDVDRKPSTGNAMWAWAGTLGSEYLVQSGFLYEANGSGGWQEAATGLSYARSGTGDAKTIEWTLPLADLHAGDAKSVHVAFLSNNYAMPDPAGDPAEISLMAKPQLTVDGDPSDWAGIQPLTVTADGLTTVKTYVTDDKLFALIDGRIDNAEFPNLWEHLFLDTDKNPSTGTSSWAWAGKLGAEYLVQTAILYASNGSSGWDQTPAVFPYVSAGTGDHKVIEWSVPLSELGITDEQSIHAGFLSNSYAAPDASGDPAVIQLRSSGSSITVDGDDSDWSGVELGAAAGGSSYVLDAVQDERKLYVRVKGKNLDLRNVYYLNTDGDSATGASTGLWTEGGFDYKIDRGTLYEYNQQNGSWEEKGPVYLAVTDDAIEINVYLDQLGLDEPAPIKLGYANRGMLQLPMGGSAPLTVDNTVRTQETAGVFYPRQSFELLNNPFMGWVAWAKDSSKADGTPYPQQHSLVYAGISWRELEPVKGQFDWAGIEQKYQFAYWASQGKRINLRIVMDTPTADPSHKDIPDWLYDELAAEGNAGTWYDTQEVGSGFSPNYNSETLLAEHERMIAKVAERYDNDPRIAFVQLGSLGHWGEWHTWPSGSGVFPKLSISDQYVQHYLDAFKHKQIGMRKPFPIASEQRTGLFNDVFGIKSSTDEWVGWTQNGWSGIGEFVDNPADAASAQAASAMPDFWKYAYSGGEFANGNPESWLTDDAVMESLRQMRVSHTSWLGPSSPARTAYGTDIQSNIETMQKMMGYRYVIEAVKHSDSAAHGTSISFETVLNNKGVAPFYQDWKLEYSLADANGTIVYKERQNTDLRTLLPGRHVLEQQLNLPSTLAAGSYKLLIAVIDPATDSPGMELAIDGKRPDGRYGVGSLTVTGSSGSAGSGNGSAPAADDGKVQRLNNPVLTDGKLAVTLLTGKEKLEVPLQASALVDNPSIVVSDGKVSWELPGSLLAKAKEQAGSGAAWLTITVKPGLDLASYAAKDNAAAQGIGQAVSFGLAVTTATGEKTIDFAATPVKVSLKPDSTDVNAVNLYGIQNERLKAASASFRSGVLTAQITAPGTYQWLNYEKVFRDVAAGHWAADAIEALAAKQVMQGVDRDRFAPNRSVTRVELAAMLARILGLGTVPDGGTQTPFRDVPAQAWYTEELKEVLAAGLMNGYGDTFRPNAEITREELAVLAIRAAAKISGEAAAVTSPNHEDASYRDAEQISDWASDSVIKAKQLGLLIGDEDGRFRPREGVSRAEAAVITLRLMEMLLK